MPNEQVSERTNECETWWCRWRATGAQPHATWPLHQMQWLLAASRVGQAASRCQPTAPTATRTGLPACSPDWCMPTAMCWPASGARAAAPWTCCLASWQPSAATVVPQPASGAMQGPTHTETFLPFARHVFTQHHQFSFCTSNLHSYVCSVDKPSLFTHAHTLPSILYCTCKSDQLQISPSQADDRRFVLH